MKRETRYVVLKQTDIARLTTELQAMLAFVCDKINSDRTSKGKPPLIAAVVEHDWPEYEPTWKAIEARVDGETP